MFLLRRRCWRKASFKPYMLYAVLMSVNDDMIQNEPHEIEPCRHHVLCFPKTAIGLYDYLEFIYFNRVSRPQEQQNDNFFYSWVVVNKNAP